MHKDGVREVEKGLFSQTIVFPDSYQSAREDKQKAIIGVGGILDYFGAETLVQFNVCNTPCLREEIGKRRFFDVNKTKTPVRMLAFSIKFRMIRCAKAYLISIVIVCSEQKILPIR